MKTIHMAFLASAASILEMTTGMAQPSNLSSWKTLAEGGAQVEITQVSATPPVLDGQSTNALRIIAKHPGNGWWAWPRLWRVWWRWTPTFYRLEILATARWSHTARPSRRNLIHPQTRRQTNELLLV